MLSRTSCWIVDADDTLWESAAFFRDAEDSFTGLMAGMGFLASRIREEVRRRDMARLPVTGYGPGPYMDTLQAILQDHCLEPPVHVLESFEGIRTALCRHPVAPFPGVEETLFHLSGLGHRLVLYTMGQTDHQLDKFARSGMAGFFEECVVVPRKTARSLEDLLKRLGVQWDSVCAVGNSPRSDIAPAIECGVNAILVNRPGTWEAEQLELPPSPLVASVEQFSDIPELLKEGEKAEA